MSKLCLFIPRFRAEPLMMLCESLLGTSWWNILKLNTLRFGNGIGPCLQAGVLYNKMLLQNT